MTQFYNCNVCRAMPCACHTAVLPSVCPLCGVVHTTSICPRTTAAAPMPGWGAPLTIQTLPFGQLPRLSDSDVDRIAKRVVEMMRSDWCPHCKSAPCAGVNVKFGGDIVKVHVDPTLGPNEMRMIQDGIRHDEGEG